MVRDGNGLREVADYNILTRRFEYAAIKAISKCAKFSYNLEITLVI